VVYAAFEIILRAIRGLYVFRVRSTHRFHTVSQAPPTSAVAPVPERLLESDEAASIMNVHPETLQKLARKGVVRGAHVGKL
jgi:hypothetical protein